MCSFRVLYLIKRIFLTDASIFAQYYIKIHVYYTLYFDNIRFYEININFHTRKIKEVILLLRKFILNTNKSHE